MAKLSGKSSKQIHFSVKMGERRGFVLRYKRRVLLLFGLDHQRDSSVDSLVPDSRTFSSQSRIFRARTLIKAGSPHYGEKQSFCSSTTARKVDEPCRK